MIPGNEKFKFEQVMRDGKKIINLVGDIDEDTNLQPLLRLGSPLIFNFSQVRSINSCGVRSWVNFLKELGTTAVAYTECPPLIVRQMNMVPSFAGQAQVLSIYAPFVCDNCEEEKLVLIPQNQFASLGSVPALPCDKCGKGEMELDGHPQQYTAFAK